MQNFEAHRTHHLTFMLRAVVRRSSIFGLFEDFFEIPVTVPYVCCCDNQESPHIRTSLYTQTESWPTNTPQNLEKKTKPESQSFQNGVPAAFSKHHAFFMKLTLSWLLFVRIIYHMNKFSTLSEYPAGRPLRGDKRSSPLSALSVDDFR